MQFINIYNDFLGAITLEFLILLLEQFSIFKRFLYSSPFFNILWLDMLQTFIRECTEKFNIKVSRIENRKI